MWFRLERRNSRYWEGKGGKKQKARLSLKCSLAAVWSDSDSEAEAGSFFPAPRSASIDGSSNFRQSGRAENVVESGDMPLLVGRGSASTYWAVVH